MRTPHTTSALALTIALAALASGCTQSNADERAEEPSPTTTTQAPQEQSARTARIAVTHDEGVTYLDATTLEVIGSTPSTGFVRLNPAGDNRHLFLTTQGGFELLDTGTYGQAHGDHAHYYTQNPDTTGVVRAAEKPGHVVVHDGYTALFDDGTGRVDVYETNAITEEPIRTWQAPHAHHGVAIARADGSLIVTVGTEEERTGVAIIDEADNTIAETDQCPGVHGEAAAANGRIVVGCQDGIVIIDGDTITKVDAPDTYGRIGNQAGTHTSPIVLGDYKTDPDAELERPTRISLTNTATAELTLVDLPSSYSFRSLERDDDGNALVLGTDGNLHIIDPVTATITASVPVTQPWEEPTEWQQPRPTVRYLDGMAYVTDPATKRIVAVDTVDATIWKETTLDITPNEISGVTGAAPTAHDHEGHDHSDEPTDNDDHDADHSDEPTDNDDHEGHDHN